MKLFVYVFLLSTFLFACRSGGKQEGSTDADLPLSTADEDLDLEKSVTDLIAFEDEHFFKTKKDGSLALTGSRSFFQRLFNEKSVSVTIKHGEGNKHIGKLTSSPNGKIAVEDAGKVSSLDDVFKKYEIHEVIIKKEGRFSKTDEDYLYDKGYSILYPRNPSTIKASDEATYLVIPNSEFHKMVDDVQKKLISKQSNKNSNYSMEESVTKVGDRTYIQYTVAYRGHEGKDEVFFTIGKTYSEEAKDFARRSAEGYSTALAASAIISASLVSKKGTMAAGLISGSLAAGRTLYLGSPGFRAAMDDLVYKMNDFKSPFVNAAVKDVKSALGKTDALLRLDRASLIAKAQEYNDFAIEYTKKSLNDSFPVGGKVDTKSREDLRDLLEASLKQVPYLKKHQDPEGLKALATGFLPADAATWVVATWMGKVANVTNAIIKYYGKSRIG